MAGKVPRCHIPWQEMNIDADGNVTPCCNWKSHNNADNPYCGNVKEQTLEQIWNGEVYRKIRRDMASGDLRESGCAKCMIIVRGEPSKFRYDEDVEAELTAPEGPSSPYAKNMALLKQEVAAGAEVMEAKPTVLSVTPSYACNIRCVHCYQEPLRTKDLNQPSLFEQISDLAPVLSHISCGGGEPFLLPIWKDFIDQVDLDENPYLTFAACTNATLLTPGMVERIEKFKRVQIGISMDAGTKEVYENVRIKSKFETVDKNAERLVQITKSRPGSYVSMSMAVMRNNIEDVANFFIYSASRGATSGLSPVMAMPSDQAITCFNDPQKELPRWRAALDRAIEAVKTIDYVKHHISLDEEGVRRNYFAQIKFVRDQIPWEIEARHHIYIEGELPASLLERPTTKLDELIVIFSPAAASPAAAPLYFSKIDGARFSVFLPPGSYRIGIIKRFDWPKYNLSWQVKISANGLALFERTLGGSIQNDIINDAEPISSASAEGYAPIYAFQENTNTWVSAEAGSNVANCSYIGIRLNGEEKPPLKEVRVQWAFDYCTPVKVALQYSDDGNVWSTDAIHKPGLKDATKTFWWEAITAKSGVPHCYWRLLALANGSGHMAVGQIQFIKR